jgi:hypothetical protein
MGSKGGDETTIGYRYSFSILAGICRGPIDSIFLIKADGKVFYDLEVTQNSVVQVLADQLFGGDKGEGGLYGVLELYFGRFDQVIPFLSWIRTIMAGLRVPQMRGVVTSFYDGEVTANTPYPKAWAYRVRRAVKGWKNDECWYPERAMIRLADSSIATYAGSPTGYFQAASSTTLVDADGNPTSDPTASVSTVTTTYQQQTVTSYSPQAGTSTTYNVPNFYNDIRAMNPAHIIYQCVTDPDWGRGLPRELVDNVSFASAANTLYAEGFGLCMKWSQQEDVDAFVQNVIDHIAAAVYTNPVTGLLCLRLLRNDYTPSDLSVFDYAHGLLEVTSVSTASSDAIANEVIVKYHSPVTDSDKEARAQNIASLNSLGSFFTVTKDYSGLPTADLALRVAARELKINGGGWKRVEFKVDRRGYTIVPGDVLKITAPERGLDQMIVRIATVDQSEIKDDSITIVGTQDIYGLPLQPTSTPQISTFMEVNRYPQPARVINTWEAPYRDWVKVKGQSFVDNYINDPANFVAQNTSALEVAAEKPSSASIFYYACTSFYRSAFHPGGLIHDWEKRNALNFQHVARLKRPIGTTDTTFEISGQSINPSNARIGGAYYICAESNFSVYSEEYVRLDAISMNPGTGVVTVTVARGCVDTPALMHPGASRFWAIDESIGLVDELVSYNDLLGFKALTHTSMGDLDVNRAPGTYMSMTARLVRPYPAADFRINGYPRDSTPDLSGDLTITWKHRNRMTQGEHLFGETEANITPENGTYVGFFIFPTRTGPPSPPLPAGSGLAQYAPPTVSFQIGSPYYHIMGADTTSVTIPASDFLLENTITGPMSIIMWTTRVDGDPPYTQVVMGSSLVGLGWVQPQIHFNYIVDPIEPDPRTDGFSFEFDYNFGGG